MLSSLDLLPLMLVAAGGKLPTNHRSMDATLIQSLLARPRLPTMPCIGSGMKECDNQWRAMREQQFKLVRAADDKPWELYDLLADIDEQNNLAPKRPELVKTLAKKFANWHQAAEKEGIATGRAQNHRLIAQWRDREAIQPQSPPL